MYGILDVPVHLAEAKVRVSGYIYPITTYERPFYVHPLPAVPVQRTQVEQNEMFGNGHAR